MTINITSKTALITQAIIFDSEDTNLPTRLNFHFTHNFIDIISQDINGVDVSAGLEILLLKEKFCCLVFLSDLYSIYT